MTLVSIFSPGSESLIKQEGFPNIEVFLLDDHLTNKEGILMMSSTKLSACAWDRSSKVNYYLCCVGKCFLCIQLLWLYFSFSHLTWKIWHAHCLMLESFVVLSYLKTQGKFKSVFQCGSTVNEIKCSTIFLHTVCSFFLCELQQTKTLWTHVFSFTVCYKTHLCLVETLSPVCTLKSVH